MAFVRSPMRSLYSSLSPRVVSWSGVSSTSQSCHTPDQETTLGNSEEYEERMGLLSNAMSDLNDREKAIFQARRLRENPATLEELAQEYNVSRERIRQIEVRAFEKVQEAVTHAARQKAAHHREEA